MENQEILHVVINKVNLNKVSGGGGGVTEKTN